MNIREIIEVSSTGLSKRWLVFAMFSQVSARVLEVTWFSCVIHLFFSRIDRVRCRCSSFSTRQDERSRCVYSRIVTYKFSWALLSWQKLDRKSLLWNGVWNRHFCVWWTKRCKTIVRFVFFFYTYWCDFYISLCDYYNFSFIFYLLYGYKYIYICNIYRVRCNSKRFRIALFL